ncbi:uncharacterized protein PV06_01605 [Exophiala oligosperma]|uniref:Uncharacterized protein n=1 Tax=Exophiala oligosperma TaxID=215243 RepID=A0A0D2ED74_9EURO|nr:uncharacterized protein PV06_01605 [Exophiala oligosperma]KIW45899.1 hypothetical protein PV06_01605 [Exophiala oligosperma]
MYTSLVTHHSEWCLRALTFIVADLAYKPLPLVSTTPNLALMSDSPSKMNFSRPCFFKGRLSCQNVTTQPIPFLDEPFKTWHSTIFLVVFVLAFAIVTAFLGYRYVEALKFKSCSCCKSILNPERQAFEPDMEGQRCQGRWKKEVHDIPPIQSCDPHTDQIQQRIRPREVRLSIVELGEVRESGIARRRASNPRITTD